MKVKIPCPLCKEDMELYVIGDGALQLECKKCGIVHNYYKPN
ncbi:MAG: hypothetical protein ACYDG2_01720 [Ruminiclostridium sp.]